MKNCFPEKITREEIAECAACTFGGEIVVVEDEEQLLKACAYLRTQKVIGFDTETRPAFKAGTVNRVALLQLSTREKTFLIRLSKLRLDKAIVKILTSKDIIKVGAGLDNDLRALQRLRRFRPEGFMELQNIVSDWGIADKSVRKIAAIVLGVRVSKAQRLSNWEAAQLTPAQQLYAATDAWICLEILDRLEKTDRKKLAAHPQNLALPAGEQKIQLE